VVEAIVLAILLGMAVRAAWKPGPRWAPGGAFTAKPVLEAAIVLLGASIDLAVVARAGAPLLLGIAAAVVATIAAGTALGRLLGLEPKHAVLVACGNAICGNSAIAAVAPAIGARQEHVASAIAFTAVLGVAMVLGLPALVPLLGLSHYQYGVLAGMTVYAVPQVLAASFPVSALSGEVGTFVKLVRVLMLGPVVLYYSLRYRGDAGGARASGLGKYVPWFIVGFLLLAAARSAGLLPAEVALPLRELSRALTIAAMAALGLGVDVRALKGVGRPVVATVVASLAVILLASLLVVQIVVGRGS
jgi:uncharacterized integral membrane protein (TIGR00698 family)